VRAGGYDEVLGHNIAGVFLEALPAEALLRIAGRPLTEPFWARVPVAGEQRDVLLQAFERRVLTFTPTNPAGWQVEWGNAGRQYAQWRYGDLDLVASFEPQSVVELSAAARDLHVLSPAAAAIARDRQGLVGVAVYQLATGDLHSFQGTQAFPMYSTTKVPIMLTVLDRALREERQVAAREQALIEAMIKVSDNNAASALLADVGGAAVVERYLKRIGITNTHMNDYAWGSSTTTAQDMARLMAKLGSCSTLVPRLCRYALETMQNVVRSQKWGVSAGVPDPGGVALKNGWYPQRNGWGINSIGLVTSGGKQYAIAVFTNPDPSMAYGVETIERISTEVFPAVP
jgi:beta-lactamase class A